MQDIEQDQDIHGDTLSGHIRQHHHQQDGAEEENEYEVGAACAQGLHCSPLRLEPKHSP